MGIRKLSLFVAASALLASCAIDDGPDTSTWTYQQVLEYQAQKNAQYQRDLAVSQQILQQSGQFLNQQTRALQDQNSQWVAPQVAPVGQPSGTAVVYCRDLTGSVVACRQIR